MPKGIFLALANPVSEAVEADFNAWYEARTPEVLALPGVNSCTRYALAGEQVMPGDDAMGYGYLALYEVEVDDWADFSAAMQEGFAEGKITIDANLLSMDPMVKTIVFEQVGERMTLTDDAMKIGIFVSDTGGERTGVEEVQRRAQWVEENGFTSAWVPQIPWSLDALTALVARGRSHRPHRARHRGGAHVSAPPARPRPAGAVGAGRERRAADARHRPVAPGGRREHARAELREAVLRIPSSTSRCSSARSPGPARCTSRVSEYPGQRAARRAGRARRCRS